MTRAEDISSISHFTHTFATEFYSYLCHGVHIFTYVLFYSSFKQFLELEPQLRNLLHKFYESQYADCLKLLDDMKVRRFYIYEIVIPLSSEPP